MSLVLRPAGPTDFSAILALNAESVHFLSPLDAVRLAALHREAALRLVACRANEVAAFLLAFREGAAYDSENYRWFAARYPRFLYVDRVVVSAAQRGQRIGDALYAALFAHARESEVSTVVCEYDLDPPNPASQRFHAKHGFREVGTQLVAGGKKRVSMQLLELC
ncbi:MAG: GNAT family N-acetyltransferase [Deltaproteobacteria bacterium]|nr:GNAT family N-acetyltransferase [Deltaproteobacteria bacterium]